VKNNNSRKKTSRPTKRCGVFDREQAKRDGKAAMDILWKMGSKARLDLSVTDYEVGSYESSLKAVEQELYALTLPPGIAPALPVDFFED
jgi:hypothetical protein